MIEARRTIRAEIWRREAASSFESFCRLALAPLGQEPAQHHLLLIRELEALARGDTRNLMVQMPPGSAKSTYTSKLFPAWLLAREPNIRLIGASNTADLAEQFSGETQAILVEHGIRIAGIGPRTRPAKFWRTTANGHYRAAGVGGTITGFRADIAIIDDPIKSAEEADSEVIREKQWQWITRDLNTRLKPGGRIALVMTRWHEDDIAGRLLLHLAHRWRVVKLPAVAGDDDPLGRAPGNWLWDGGAYGYGADLRAKKADLEASGDHRSWWSLYQQEPRSPDGLLFKVAALRIFDVPPAIPWEAPQPPNAPRADLSPIPAARPAQHGTAATGAVVTVVRAWDLAATAASTGRDPDWTVGLKLARLDTGGYVVLDVVRLRGGPEDVEAAILNTAVQDGPRVAISLPQDPGQAGKVQALTYVRKLAGYSVTVSPETGDKSTRAGPAASQVNVGNVALVRSSWNRPLIEELRDFPTGRHDDIADAFSRAMGMLTTKPSPARRMDVAIIGR